MADNGRWFKLWCSAPHDPDLSNLDIADFGRWCKLGAYIKEHGNEGEIVLSSPAFHVTAMMQLSTFQDVILCINKFPNVTVSPVTNTTVSYLIKYQNWHKYQGDFSTDRVKKFRAKKRQSETPKKRGEEKRREETKKRKENTPIVPAFETFFLAYPRKEAKRKALESWIRIEPQNGTVEKIMTALEVHKKSDQWQKENGQFIPLPATWLNQHRWEDEVTTKPKMAWED